MIALYAAAIADLCGPPPAPVAPPDPADAARYVQVGDDAVKTGDARVAAIAYRAALARDPGNTAASRALAELCKTPPEEGADLTAAIELYRAGHLDDAEQALRAIVAGGGSSVAGAHFFLGMIALARHGGGEAVDELELARRDPAYEDAARAVLPLARRDGPLSAVLLAEPELDTNPALLPDTPPMGATTGPRQTDEDLLLAGTVTARPTRWLFVRDVLTWREQRQLDMLDFLGENAQAGVELDGGGNHVAIRYDFDYDLLAKSPYLIANRGLAQVRRDVGGAALVASYGLRRRVYQQDAQAGFTGWVHAADAGAILHVSPRFDLDARATLTRELTEDRSFADVAIGAAATARARLASGVRLVAAAAGWYASYDAAEPDGELRRDGHGELGADVEYDLGDHVLGTCGAIAIGNTSTIDDFNYWKLVVRCGLALAIGGP
ncbi:MAG: hypothetical protein ACM31C_32695 [Acidobacteriota bacterium]